MTSTQFQSTENWLNWLEALNAATTDGEVLALLAEYLTADALQVVALYRPSQGAADATAAAIWPHPLPLPLLPTERLPTDHTFWNDLRTEQVCPVSCKRGAWLVLPRQAQMVGWIFIGWWEERPFTAAEQQTCRLLAATIAPILATMQPLLNQTLLSLQASEQRYKRILQETADIVYTFSHKQGGLFYSPRVFDVLGYTPEYLQSHPYHWRHAIHPDDLIKINALVKQLPLQTPFTFEYRIRHRDGHWVWLRDHSIGYTLDNGDTIIEGMATDITAEVSTRQALQTSEARLRLLAENSHDIIFLAHLKPHLSFDYINAALTSVLGYLPEELYANPKLAFQMVHPDDADTFAAMIQNTPTQPHRLLLRWLHRDGHTVWIEQVNIPLLNEAGKSVAIQSIARDITERINKEDELLRREQFLTRLKDLTQTALSALSFDDMLQRLANHAADVFHAEGAYVTLWDETTQRTIPGAAFGKQQQSYRQIEINPQEPTLTRQALTLAQTLVIEDAMNTPYLSPRLAQLFPQRALMAIPLIAGYENLGALIISFADQRPFTREDVEFGEQMGQVVALTLARGLLERDLEEKVVQRTAEIVAERDKTEAILAQTTHSMTLLDGDGRILFANQAHLDTTQYTLPELLGQPCTKFMVAATIPIHTWQQLKPRETWRDQVDIRRKDNSTFTVDVAVRALFDAGGSRTGFVCSHVDISKYLEVEEMHRRFLTHASHQLRTPITNLALYLDLLRMAPQNGEKYIETLRKEVTRLTELVAGLMMMNEVESLDGRTSLMPQSPQRVVEAALETVADKAAARQIALRHHLPAAGSLPEVGGTDNYLSKAVVEILENAIKFSPVGGEVVVATGVGQVNGRTGVTIAITDKGPGIPVPEQNRIYDFFYRNQDQAYGREGHGLGLGIAKTIISKHGGAIHLHSEEGVGSTFTIWLPPLNT